MFDDSSNGSVPRFDVLGPVMVRRGTVEIRIGSAKHQRLLAALLLYANERVDRAKIIDVIWGLTPPKSAINLVQKYVGDLRRALTPTGSVLRPISGGYQLRVPADHLDSATFVDLLDIAKNQHTTGNLAEAERRLREALALWRGPAFDGIDTELVNTERARLDELRVAACEDLAEITLARGDHDTAAAELARLTPAYPLRERLRECQMVALYRQGRRAEALAVFTTVRTLLADELGIDPGPRLCRYYEQILRDDPALEALTGPDPIDTPDPVLPVRQLPLDVSDFVGRAALLREMTRSLGTSSPDGPPTVMVVVGGPGVGKSSVVIHAAHAVKTAFPDGQLYLDLTATSDEPRDPAQVLAEALRALSVTGHAIPDSLSERAALYRSLLADRRMLVVLDDAGHPEQVRPLLPAAGGCAVLITSRNLLTQLPGARHIDLDVLSSAEARQLFTGIVGPQRVATEPNETEAILACCGNLPLAIRIAGTKLAGRPGWSLRVLRERLEDESRRLAELRIGDLGVRASVELSLRQLPGQVVRTLRLLGLLGPYTLPGWVVGPLLDRADAEDVLEVLVDASLVRLTSTDAVGQPRYRLHDLIRTYATETAVQIPLPDRQAAITRVLAAWLELAERASDQLPAGLFTPASGTAPRWSLPDRVVDRLVGDASGWFDSERDTLLGAVKLATDWGLDEMAWELAAAAVTYYDHRSLYQDWQHGHYVALNAVRTAGNRRGESVLLRGLGQVHIYRDNFDEAVRALELSQDLSQRCGDKLGEALSVAMLATVSRVRQRYDDAADRVQHALVIAVAEGDRHLEAQLRGSMAIMLLAQEHLEEAACWFDEALTLARALGDRHRVAVLLRRQSKLHDRRGEPDTALECLRQALGTFQDLADERCAAYTLLEMGRVHVGRCDREQAVAALESAAVVFRRHGDRGDEATCWHLLGTVDIAVSDHGSARRHLGHAQRLWRAIGDVAQTKAVTAVLGPITAAAEDQHTRQQLTH